MRRQNQPSNESREFQKKKPPESDTGNFQCLLMVVSEPDYLVGRDDLLDARLKG